MTHERFEQEMNYRVSLHIAKTMRENGLITEKEYCQIDTMLIRKYCPIIGSL